MLRRRLLVLDSIGRRLGGMNKTAYVCYRVPLATGLSLHKQACRYAHQGVDHAGRYGFWPGIQR